MAELVYALDLGSSGETRESSSLSCRTIHHVHRTTQSKVKNMQVSVEAAEGLERRMRVSIPAADYEHAVKKNLNKIGRHARVDGFRPGKVPAQVLEQRYGARARQDALSDLLEDSYPRALQESGVQPAGQPQIEFEAIETGKDMAYVATFDVYPDIELQGLEGMLVKEAETEIGDADVDSLLQKLREQRKTWADKDGAAAEGDRVKIDFVGTIDGEAFEGGSGEDTDLELGSGRFLKEMEDGIVGMSAGESRDMPVTFPEDYHAENLKGKLASFAVTVKSVQASALPEVDAEFCKQFGLEESDEAGLREKLRESMEQEKSQAIARYTKQQVLENILATNDIPVPSGLVSQEIERMRHDAAQRFGQGQQNHDELHKMLPDALFEEQAKRRTALGLLIGEIIKKDSLQVTDEQIEAKLAEIAGGFDDSDAALAYYRQNPQFMQSLRAMVLEDQVVQHCLSKAKRETEKLSFEELTEKAPSQG